MNISPLSFGKRIPIAKCQIQEKETGKFVPATIYEVDCTDKEDFLEIKNLDRKWSFKYWIGENMDMKHSLKTELNEDCNLSFYQIRDEKGELLGISQVKEMGGTHDLSFIDTKPRNPYRYTGQAFLAGIASSVLKKDGFRLIVTNPIDEAADFYRNTCGFELLGDYIFKMNRSQIKDFIARTEERTQAPLINLKG